MCRINIENNRIDKNYSIKIPNMIKLHHQRNSRSKDAFAMSVIQKIEDYKEEHPNYQKEIKKASIAESKKRYKEYLAEQKKSALQN